MKREEYNKICSAVKAGKETEVTHIITHQKGKVIGCHEETDFFEVEVGGDRREWAKENVREESRE